jgi:sugar phosphate isomerase/epimerase
MELTLSTHLLVYHELRSEALAALAAGGYPQLELWMAEPHVPWRDASAIEAFAARLGDHGLTVASVHLPFYPSVPGLLERNERWSLMAPTAAARREALQGAADGLHAAARCGATEAVLHLGWQGDAWPEAAAAWAREAVLELMPVAREAGVRLLLENIISPGTRIARLLELLEEVDPGREVGLCVDLGHAHVEGDVVEELRLALPRLAHLHVHDNDGTNDAHLAPGHGTIPWDQVMALLREAGYQGRGALELRDHARGDLAEAEVLRHHLREVDDFRRRWLPTPT